MHVVLLPRKRPKNPLLVDDFCECCRILLPSLEFYGRSLGGPVLIQAGHVVPCFLLALMQVSLFKSGLKFFLLNFKATALFVKFVDGTATISKLIQEVLDFICEVLVLPLDYIKLFHGFIMGSLKSEKFAVVVSAFLLACFNFSSNVISLGLPFSNNLVEVTSTLLGDDSSSMGSFVFHGNFF